LSDHLTQIQIENYGRRQLAAVDLLPVSDHLGVCEACRHQVQRAMNGDAAYLALRSELFSGITTPAVEWEHLTFEQLTGLVDSTITGYELQVANDHLAICQQCLLAVDDLRAFKVQVEPELERQFASPSATAESRTEKNLLPRFWPKSLVFGSALAVLLLAASGWMAWQAFKGSEQQSTTAKQTAPPSPTPATSSVTGSNSAGEIALLEDGAGRVRLDGEGRLSGVEQLPPAYQQLVKKALTSQELERSPLLAGLAPDGSIPRGGSDEPVKRFSLIEPVRTVTLSEHPTFRWARLKGATGYVVEIYNEDFDPVSSSPRLSERRWKVPQALKRGAIYYWQVKAIKDGKELISPYPSTQQVKFRILDEAKANELLRVRQSYGSSHLVLGLLYADAGLLDEAEGEFLALQKANPGSAIADRLLRQVRQR